MLQPDFSMGYPNETMYNHQYTARVRPQLGVCVYHVENVDGYCAQLFPIVETKPVGDIQQDFSSYVIHVLYLARADGANMKLSQESFKYFNCIEDVLTLKCLIEEAAEEWSKLNVTHTT